MIGLLLHNVNLQSDLYTLLLKSHVNGEFVWLLKKKCIWSNCYEKVLYVPVCVNTHTTYLMRRQ